MAESRSSLNKKQLISLVGYQGSGKTTIGRKLAKRLKTEHIETSDIVKALFKDLSRSQLPATAQRTSKDSSWLGRQIAEDLKRVYKDKDVAVITGVREMAVHKYLLRQGLHIWAVDISSDAETRFHRLRELGKIKDASEFIEHELKEREMGLDKVKEKAPFLVNTTETTSPARIADAIIVKLISKGADL